MHRTLISDHTSQGGTVCTKPRTATGMDGTLQILFAEILFGDILGTIQVLRHQRGGWVGSENGNF